MEFIVGLVGLGGRGPAKKSPFVAALCGETAQKSTVIYYTGDPPPMPVVIGVRFKDSGKVYYFDPRELNPHPGEYLSLIHI